MSRPDPYLAFVGFYNDWSKHMEGDAAFYTRLALEAEGPVVELGVGTGRVAIPVARAGKDVIGVDVSEAMMADGERRAREAGVAERIRWVHADMREHVADPPVHLVTIPARSFLHLTTTDDQLAALEAIRRSLVPGGRLALNVFVPDPGVIVSSDGVRRHIDSFTDERGRHCELAALATYEAVTQRVSLRAICDVYDGERLADSIEALLELRMVYRYEMEHLLVRAGFEIEALYGWFDERPLTPDSKEMVWVARKPT